MKVSSINFNKFNLPFCATIRLKSSDLKTKFKEVPNNEEPVTYSNNGIRPVKQSEYREISSVIDKAGNYDDKRGGYHSTRPNYSRSFYDYPITFAIDVVQKKKTGEDTHIIDEIPKMFKGLNKDELLFTLDRVCMFLKNNKDEIIFKIGDREFKTERLGSGAYGATYKLSSDGFSPLAMKVYTFPKNVSNHGPFGEISLERELNKAGVIDVPKFYMASPYGAEVMKDGDRESSIYASWKISEFVDKTTPLKQGNLTLKKYLKQKGLIHTDMGDQNKVGNYWVDLGGVENKKDKGFFSNYCYLNKSLILDMIEKK